MAIVTIYDLGGYRSKSEVFLADMDAASAENIAYHEAQQVVHQMKKSGKALSNGQFVAEISKRLEALGWKRDPSIVHVCMCNLDWISSLPENAS